MATAVEEYTALFLRAGLTPTHADTTARGKLAALFARLLQVFFAAAPADLPTGARGGLAVFCLAQKCGREDALPQNWELLVRAAAAGRIVSDKQMLEGLRFLTSDAARAAPDADALAAELDVAAGVGVVVTDADIAQAVSTVITEHQFRINTERYAFPAIYLLAPLTQGPLKWADGGAVKAEVDKQLADLLGPKTAEDEKAIQAARKSGKKDTAAAAAATAPAAAVATTTAVAGADSSAPASTAAASAEPNHAADAATHAGHAHEHEHHEQIVTPWEVQAGDEGIDYTRLIRDFGCEEISPELIARLERLTGKPAHHFFRRGLFFSHRDFDRILDSVEHGTPFFLYTGRGPSSEAMHLGHLVPFLCCKYLQDAFGVPLVIQMTDDEKFLWKDLTIEEANRLAYENARDIIAVGFDPEKTYIFVDTEVMGGEFYRNVLRFQKKVTLTNASKVCSGESVQ
jgi:hypothetical protein